MEVVEIGKRNVADYLAARNWPPPSGRPGARPGPRPGETLRVTPLGGGVSNNVLLVESAAARVVVKQSLEKLRVKDDWRAERGRIFRECASIRALAGVLPAACLPQIVLEDEANFLFVMTAAPAGARPWKTDLLEGRIEAPLAARAGALLAAIHAFSHGHAEIRERFADQTCFEQLRVDPYYRTCARRHPELAAPIGALIEAMDGRRLALVHGDYSPKNMLVMRQGAWQGEAGAPELFLIDFEVVHYGDPAFDTGFCLNHLLLKSFHHPRRRAEYRDAARAFWSAYVAGVPRPIAEGIEEATCHHLGALLLARVDGKSPAEYLGEAAGAEVRAAARRVLLERPRRLEEVFALCRPSER